MNQLWTEEPLEAIKRLRDGHALIHPTESVYGLGCLPRCLDAIKNLRIWKDRPKSSGFILVGALREHFEPYLQGGGLPEQFWHCIQSSNAHHPSTWIVPAREGLAPEICGEGKGIAIRWTSHPPLVRLLSSLKQPILSTSANRRGAPPAKEWEEVVPWLQSERAWLSGWRAPLGPALGPSSIYDLVKKRWIRLPAVEKGNDPFVGSLPKLQ